MNLLYFLEGIRVPFVDKIMLALTELGGETAFIAFAILIFWCFDKKCGYYMFTVGFAGTVLNQFLKLWFRIPRPWVQDPDFTILEAAREAATGYSFPSGHTQNAFTIFGSIARYTKKAWLRIVCIVLLVLIPFSRMYVGVHTPLDVGVSIIAGLVLVFGVYPIFRNMDSKPKAVYIVFALFILLALAFVLFVELYNFPTDLDMENYESGLKSAYMMLFCSVGLLSDFYVDRRYIKFETDAVWWAQLIKLALGLAIALGLKAGLKAPLLALCGGHAVSHGIRYFILVIFAGMIWPLTFKFFARLGKKS